MRQKGKLAQSRTEGTQETTPYKSIQDGTSAHDALQMISTPPNMDAVVSLPPVLNLQYPRQNVELEDQHQNPIETPSSNMNAIIRLHPNLNLQHPRQNVRLEDQYQNSVELSHLTTNQHCMCDFRDTGYRTKTQRIGDEEQYSALLSRNFNQFFEPLQGDDASNPVFDQVNFSIKYLEINFTTAYSFNFICKFKVKKTVYSITICENHIRFAIELFCDL